MFKKIKAVCAPFAVLVFLLSSGFTLAQAPDDNITRAELVQMVIEASDSLEEAPSSPTFKDVSESAEYYSHVETAAKLGIIDGYKDGSGNPTGYFGPNDTLTRAAAMKVLTLAFDLPQSSGKSPFPDVKSRDWYHNYIVSAFDLSIISGYENGYFGPGDPVTRSQANKLVTNAKAITQPEATEAELVVSLSAEQAPALVVPLASTAPLINIDFTAKGEDISVSEITLQRKGVGVAADWFAIYAYEGFFKITAEYNVSRDDSTVKMPFDFTVKEGETRTISFYGDTDTISVPTNQHFFGIVSASSIVATTENITGDFAMYGNAINIGAQTANTVSVTAGTTLPNPELDTRANIASVKLQTGSSSRVSMEAFIFHQGGSFKEEDIRECRLYNNNDLISEAAGFFEGQLIFIPTEYFEMTENQTRHFFVNCNLYGGNTNQTIQLYLDETYDLLVTDLDYGYAAAPLNSFTRSEAPTYNLTY